MTEHRCPNCGSPLTPIDDDSYICSHCNSKIAVFEDGIEVKMIDISDDPSYHYVRMCQENLASKRYSEIGRYADMILRNDPTDYRGMYYKGIFMLSAGDEKYDKMWGSAIDLSNEHWLNRMHSEIPKIFVDVNITMNKGIDTHLRFMNALLFKTRGSFDMTDSRNTGKSLYTRMISYMKELNTGYHDLKEYHILTELMDSVFSTMNIIQIMDYDLVRFMFSSAGEIAEDILDRMPIYPNYTDDTTRFIWGRVTVRCIFFTKIENRFKERLRTMNENDICGLRSFYADRESSSVSKAYSKAKDSLYGPSYYENDRKNTKAMSEMDHAVATFVDRYLRI